MARRRRIGTVGFDQKIVQDVGMAALAVRILPMIINNFFPLDQTLHTAVGAGTGYLTGSFLKNKTMANASIAIGLVEFIAPVIEGLIGGVGSLGPEIAMAPGYLGPPIKRTASLTPPGAEGGAGVADYISLNDYVPVPSNRHYQDYADSY